MTAPRSYPTVVLPADLDRVAHISDAELRRDLAQTEQEIQAYSAAATGLQQIADLDWEERGVRDLAQLRADGYRRRNADRERFVAWLRLLLDARQQRVPA